MLLKKKIMDIAKILRNAPKGTKLYSTMYGEVTLYFVDSTDFIHIKNSQGNDCTLFSDGKFGPYDDCECVLFPSKDKRDWLNWQHELFKKGDIVAYDKGNIVKVIDSVTGIDAYGIERQGLLFSNWRYATDEEKDMYYSIFDSYNVDYSGTTSARIKEIKAKKTNIESSNIKPPTPSIGNDFDFDKINFLLDSILDKLGSLQEMFEKALASKKDIHNDFQEVIKLLSEHDKL